MMVDEDILLTRGAVYRKIRKGEFIFHENTICNYYYQLIYGTVSWLNYDDSGKVFIQSIIDKGECFGILPLFDDEPYAASAQAETDCLVLRLAKPSFIQLMKDSPKLLFSFASFLSQTVRNKAYFLKEIACENPEHKVLEVLKYIRDKAHHPLDEPFKICLTRLQIAGMTGLRVETVIRVIKKLSKNGNLTINRGKVYLLNTDFYHKNDVE